jgi:hypothetical protein
MALPVGPGIDKARRALGALERDPLMRRRSADSIRASGHEHGPHQKAAYMNAPDLRCLLFIRDLAPQGPSIHEALDLAGRRNGEQAGGSAAKSAEAASDDSGVPAGVLHAGIEESQVLDRPPLDDAEEPGEVRPRGRRS